MIREIAGQEIPEYFFDLAIAYHLDNPKAYKQHRGSHFETPPKADRYIVIDGAVTVSDPPEQEPENIIPADNKNEDEATQVIPATPDLAECLEQVE